ncbi:MAG: hypothetical protein ACXWIN_02800, partial [Burkholderiaceae bacterium]
MPFSVEIVVAVSVVIVPVLVIWILPVPPDAICVMGPSSTSPVLLMLISVLLPLLAADSALTWVGSAVPCPMPSLAVMVSKLPVMLPPLLITEPVFRVMLPLPALIGAAKVRLLAGSVNKVISPPADVTPPPLMVRLPTVLVILTGLLSLLVALSELTSTMTGRY